MSAATVGDRGRVFISYRREDTAYPAGWLFERLASHLGRDKIFKDVDSIELGDDFAEVIDTAVGSCDVLLALIGDRWLTITDKAGRRRLDNPGDFVRLEIEAALRRDVRVIPVLSGGARMPQADELPTSLAKLARRQALELSPVRFDSDAARLLKVLDKTLTETQTAPPSPLQQASESARLFTSTQAAASGQSLIHGPDQDDARPQFRGGAAASVGSAHTEPDLHTSRPAPPGTGQLGSTEQTSSRTDPTHAAAGQGSPVTTDDISLLLTPGEAKAVRKDVKWFQQPTWSYSPNLGPRLADLEEMGAKRAALRLNLLDAGTAASIIDQMHSGPAAATLSETDSSHAVRIVRDMDSAKATAVLARMEPARALDLLTRMEVRRAKAIMGSLAPVLVDAVLATDIERASLLLPRMEPSEAATALARMEPTRALDLLTRMEVRRAKAIMGSLAPVLVDAVLATDIERASLLLPGMDPSEAATALARMEPTRALDLLTRMPAPDAAEIVGRMSDEMAAIMLGRIPADHAAATMGQLALEKTVPILEAMSAAEARAVLESFQRRYAQHAMALMREDKLLAVIGLMDPHLYAAIRIAAHSEGAFDMARARHLRPWKRGVLVSAFAVTLTTAVLFWAVILPRWQGPVAWSCLVWLTGLAALGLGIFVACTDTDELVPLVVSAAGFSMTAAGLALAVVHVLPVFFVTCALVAMAVSSVAIAGAGFISPEVQEHRQPRPLPDLPLSPQ